MTDFRDAALDLRAEFPVPTLEQWHAECVRLLKGASFDKTMLTPTYEGITLRPIYTRADLDRLAHVDSAPGAAPYVRGTRTLGYREMPWQVAQELPYPTAAEFNEALGHDLAHGQTAAVVTIDRAGQSGRDPDQALAVAVGAGGTSVASLADLEQALAGVDLATVPVHVESGVGALAYAALLVALARKHGLAVADLQGSVGLDPVAGLAELGRLPIALGTAYDELAILTAWAEATAPGLLTVAARGHVYHDGGASAVEELAFTLSAALHHLRELEDRGLEPETVAPRLRLDLSVGTHFFLEIARLRAARLLWSRILEAAGVAADKRRLTIHARTSRFTKTILDPHVNMLRTTTEAMAAILGGVDALHVSPFDEPLGLPDEFSRRLARNTQLVLREESHLDLVTDPAGGSWYVESLTAAVAEKTWALFQEIEAAGGIVAALASGLVQSRIAATAAARRENLARRRDVLVGTNQYPNALETPLARRTVDHPATHAARSADLQRRRADRDEAANEAVLLNLAAGLEGGGPAAFEAMVSAVIAGATVGEVSSAFRYDADPRLEIAPIAPWRAGEMFETLRAAVRDHADANATTVFCANLGDVTRYMPRLDFTRGFFQTGGFTVRADRYFASPAEAAAAARQSGAATAVIVGPDDTYAQQAAQTARELKSAGVGTVLLAGLPKDLVAEFEGAGVDGFIHIRSDAHAVLSELAQAKGVAL